MLIGAGICRVVLDPLPHPFTEALMDLASMGRKAFIETYLKSEEPSLLAAGRLDRQVATEAPLEA